LKIYLYIYQCDIEQEIACTFANQKCHEFNLNNFIFHRHLAKKFHDDNNPFASTKTSASRQAFEHKIPKMIAEINKIS